MASQRKKFNGDKYERQHSRNLNAIQRKLREIYEAVADEAANIAMLVGAIGEDEYFHFDNYPITKQRIRELMQELGEQTEAVVVNGVRSEWALANDKNDALCAFVLGNKINLSFEEQRKYFSNNNAAREAFLARAEKGMNLSERVWNYTAEYKSEIEAGLSLGLGKGKDAPALARELKRNLKAPDKLFRRVRDKYGILRLSKEARNYHPGEGRPGVYRSSYKNALRLAVTETNMAYRTADYQRYQQFDFIVGVEVHPSETNHPMPDICDQLQGRYPKGFKFVGWHPHCRCIVTSILDLSSDPQQIKNTPQQFNEWVQDNAKRIKEADKRGTTPYFVRDNRDAVENALKGGKRKSNNGNSNESSDDDKNELHEQSRKEKGFNDARKTLIRQDREIMYIINKNGTTLYKFKGDATSVSITEEMEEVMKDNWVSHNHPTGKGAKDIIQVGHSLSSQDVREAIRCDTLGFIAETSTYRYSIERPVNGWKLDAKKVKERYDEIYDEIKNEYTESLKVHPKLNIIIQHLTMKRLSKEYNLGYKYHKVSRSN